LKIDYRRACLTISFVAAIIVVLRFHPTTFIRPKAEGFLLLKPCSRE
jgi:hypothetical protein